MNKKVIENKLDNLLRCISRIEDKTPSDKSELNSSLDLQDILSINIERAVQACVDIAAIVISDSNYPYPSTMGEAFEILEKMKVIDGYLKIKLQNAVGFRNILVHDYTKVNWDIVWSIVTKNISDFKKFVKAIEKL